jgi:hypothetical protein
LPADPERTLRKSHPNATFSAPARPTGGGTRWPITRPVSPRTKAGVDGDRHVTNAG